MIATAGSIKPTNDDRVIAVPGDIGERSAAERAISEGVSRFGRIDTLVNTAGFFHATPLALAEMAKRGSGHVVQVTTSLVDHGRSAVPSSVVASLALSGRLSNLDDWRGP